MCGPKRFSVGHPSFTGHGRKTPSAAGALRGQTDNNAFSLCSAMREVSHLASLRVAAFLSMLEAREGHVMGEIY